MQREEFGPKNAAAEAYIERSSAEPYDLDFAIEIHRIDITIKAAFEPRNPQYGCAQVRQCDLPFIL